MLFSGGLSSRADRPPKTLEKEEQVLARYPNAVPGLLPLEGAASKAQVKAGAGRTVKVTAKATDGSGWSFFCFQEARL